MQKELVAQVKTHIGVVVLLLGVALLGWTEPASAEEWFQVESSDGRVSVLFPIPGADSEKMIDNTPGGKVTSDVVIHEADGIYMSISATKLPRLAMDFAGPKLIFANATGKLLSKTFGREIASESIEVKGTDAAMRIRYESVDFDDENHPGYAGLAIFAILDRHLYILNSILSRKTPDTEAMQQKLFASFQVQP